MKWPFAWESSLDGVPRRFPGLLSIPRVTRIKRWSLSSKVDFRPFRRLFSDLGGSITCCGSVASLHVVTGE